jgi:hypothetical protein
LISHTLRQVTDMASRLTLPKSGDGPIPSPLARAKTEGIKE